MPTIKNFKASRDFDKLIEKANVKLPFEATGLKVEKGKKLLKQAGIKEKPKSEFTGIEGVGPKTAKDLSKHFDSIEELKETTIEDLTKVEGIGKKTAKSLMKKLK